MTALPAPLAEVSPAHPQLVGPALPMLLALTFSPAEAAALLAHAGADDATGDRPSVVYRDLADAWGAGGGRSALVEAAVWQRLAPHARRYRALSLAEVAEFWSSQRGQLSACEAAGLVWYALLQGGLCGRRLAEQMADDCLFSGLQRPR